MRRQWPLIFLVALVVLFTALNLAFSERGGRLAGAPVYDDAVYLLDAFTRLSANQSILANAISFYRDPPHAPLSTAIGMIGFAVAGPNVLGPYAANILILGLFAVFTYLMTRRVAGSAVALPIAILIFFAPVSGAMITEFRPDMAGGVIFAIAIYLLVSTDYANASPRRLVAAGLVAALAVAAKPSAFMLVLPMLGLAYFAGTLAPGDRKRALTRSTLAIVAVLVVAVPFAAIWGPSTIAYVYEVLITERQIWATPGDAVFHWTYHSFGRGGMIALGPFFLWCAALSIGGDIAFSVRSLRTRDSYTALAYYGILFVIYFGMAMSPEKTVFQGSFFYVPVLVAMALALSRHAVRLGGLAIPTLAALITICLVALPWTTTYTKPILPHTTEMLTAVTRAIVDRVEANPNCGTLHVAAFTPYPLPPQTVALSLKMANNLTAIPTQAFFLTTPESLLEAVSTATFVIGPNRAGLHADQRAGSPFIDGVSASMVAKGWQRMDFSEFSDPPYLLIRPGC